MGVNIDLEALGLLPAQPQRVGPRGGNLDRPESFPEFRNQELQAEVQDGVRTLHRFEKPTDTSVAGLKNEQPWHRFAAYLLVEGKSPQEVAQIAGVAESTIYKLKANRWFQQLLAEIAQEMGQTITERTHAEAAASLNVLVQLRDTADSERVKLAAALAIYEHSQGKPVQKILTAKVPTVDPKTELEQLLSELESIKQAQAQKPQQPQPVEAEFAETGQADCVRMESTSGSASTTSTPH